MTRSTNDPEQLVEQITQLWRDAARESAVMPSEPALAAATGASRPSIREALVRLEERGYVHRSQGARTMINRRLGTIGIRVDRQRDHAAAIEAAGYRPAVELLSSDVAILDDDGAAFHDLPGGTRVLRTRKVWSADGDRYVLADDLIPVGGDRDAAAIDPRMPVFDLAEAANGVKVAWETVWFTPVLLEPDESAALGRSRPQAALELTYCGVGSSDEVAYWCREVQVASPPRLRNALVRRVSRS
ncbi:GntR family transcriptional regulator [Cellulomonas sp. JH27-2]|uniref:GntR family transcriptional regulator n=1 Tax=Cellulomonas sp. JH27-2 TaxID=2774139 RepID=UPI00177C7C45|nr:GntR family transcriptional regulator [Cellulomonas sp. JH27-2]MBD8058915.1 GntR family transcriptional regulator [Cellulomonas sp. JH27-2]